MKAIFETLGKSVIAYAKKKKKRGEKYAEWKGQNVWCAFIITALQSYIQTFCAGRVCPQKR